MFSIVGPNGAGKTTLIKILSTLLDPTRGIARVASFDVQKQPRLVRPHLGMVLAGSGGLIPRATALENLTFFGSLYRQNRTKANQRAITLLQQFNLHAEMNIPVNKYSTGMRQRLLLARSLMHDPPILLLDEPTNGLDPEAAYSFRALIADLRDRGKAILFCSHNMAEVAELSDSVLILVDGKVIATGSPTTVVAGATGLITISLDIPHGDATLIPALISSECVDNHSRTDDETRTRLRLVTRQPDALEAHVNHILARSGVRGIFREPATLEDAYLHIVKSTRIPS